MTTTPLLICNQLGQIIAQTSFDLWSSSQFKKLVDFDSSPKVEQDSIFNELEVSGLGLLYLHLEYLISTSKGEQKEFYEMLRENIIEGFLTIFQDLGVADKAIKQWRLLIDMRFEQYLQDYKTVLTESRKWEKVQQQEELQTIWARVETITINCLNHLRRGKVEKEDTLLKILRKWFTSLEVTLTKILQFDQVITSPVRD